MLDWLYTAISWILLRWHDFFSLFMQGDSGLTWALSIVFLVITLRVLLFRFFVRQIKSQRKMAELQPKIQALRAKYKNDRQTMSREMLKLQQEAGVNPLGGCLPILLQAPVFISLFHVLRRLVPGRDALYSWTQEQMDSASHAKLFGAPISSAFRSSADQVGALDASLTTVRIVAGTMIILMVAATYVTQRQIMARQRGQVVEGQQAMIQKLMLYGIPASLLISGAIFPVGVLCYWLTNNVWGLGQQFYILKRMPTAGDQKKEKPAVDPKVLAPKPGAKPVNPKARRPTPKQTANAEAVTEGSTAPPRGPSRPQPGKRPGGGTRPKKRRR